MGHANPAWTCYREWQDVLAQPRHGGRRKMPACLTTVKTGAHQHVLTTMRDRLSLPWGRQGPFPRLSCLLKFSPGPSHQSAGQLKTYCPPLQRGNMCLGGGLRSNLEVIPHPSDALGIQHNYLPPLPTTPLGKGASRHQPVSQGVPWTSAMPTGWPGQLWRLAPRQTLRFLST